jgi:hypothetical protein
VWCGADDGGVGQSNGWVFINPLLIGEADAWVKQNVFSEQPNADGEAVPCWPLGFASKSFDRVHLKGKDLCRFVEYMKQLGDQKGITDPVLVLEQKAGQLVHMQPGWALHQVTNMHPNVKVSWDHYDACNNMHKYLLLQHRIVSPYFGSSMGKDYMSINIHSDGGHGARRVVREWCQNSGQCANRWGSLGSN